jgi:hypothetical protein
VRNRLLGGNLSGSDGQQETLDGNIYRTYFRDETGLETLLYLRSLKMKLEERGSRRRERVQPTLSTGLY